jgi:hypothetical protein
MSDEAPHLPRSSFGRGRVHAVTGCYFAASFAAPGLPPYPAELLPELGDRNARWAGVLHVVPTVFGALDPPLWERLADRYGRTRLPLCIAVELAGHGVAGSLPALIAVRLLLRAGLTFGLVCLQVLAADCARGRAPGGPFGSPEFFPKAGAVAAGVAAAAGSARFGPAAPAPTGAAAVTVLAVTFPLPKFRTCWSR